VARTVVRPVVVAPRQRAPSAGALVVLGIDDTARSEAALDRATDDADPRNAQLEIIHASTIRAALAHSRWGSPMPETE
jgi:hypothetical protein